MLRSEGFRRKIARRIEIKWQEFTAWGSRTVLRLQPPRRFHTHFAISEALHARQLSRCIRVDAHLQEIINSHHRSCLTLILVHSGHIKPTVIKTFVSRVRDELAVRPRLFVVKIAAALAYHDMMEDIHDMNLEHLYLSSIPGEYLGRLAGKVRNCLRMDLVNSEAMSHVISWAQCRMLSLQNQYLGIGDTLRLVAAMESRLGGVVLGIGTYVSEAAIIKYSGRGMCGHIISERYRSILINWMICHEWRVADADHLHIYSIRGNFHMYPWEQIRLGTREIVRRRR